MSEACCSDWRKEEKRNIVLLVTGSVFLLMAAVGFFFPEHSFSGNIAALTGTLILAIPIFKLAVKDIMARKIYMNELVAVSIVAFIIAGAFFMAGVLSFFMLATIMIETRNIEASEIRKTRIVNNV